MPRCLIHTRIHLGRRFGVAHFLNCWNHYKQFICHCPKNNNIKEMILLLPRRWMQLGCNMFLATTCCLHWVQSYSESLLKKPIWRFHNFFYPIPCTNMRALSLQVRDCCQMSVSLRLGIGGVIFVKKGLMHCPVLEYNVISSFLGMTNSLSFEKWFASIEKSVILSWGSGKIWI